MTALAALGLDPSPASDPPGRPASVYERLRTLIIRGRLAPGVRVVERDIAVLLGVSRVPAREAIRRLYQEGFLVATATTRRTELAVAPLTPGDLRDLYLVMAALEGSAARDAADMPPRRRRDLVRALRQLEATFERAAGERPVDYDRLFERHDAFHARLVGACGRPRLRSLIAAIRPQVDRYEWVYAPLVGPDYGDTFAEHAAIIRAVAEGAADGAHAAVAANWMGGAERLSRVIDRVETLGDP